MTKEEFRSMEQEYNRWLAKHPKGDHNYKSFSHMRRSIEFAKHYSDKQVKKAGAPIDSRQSEINILLEEVASDDIDRMLSAEGLRDNAKRLLDYELNKNSKK